MADSNSTDHKLVAAITGAPFGGCCTYGDTPKFVPLADSVVFDGVVSKWSLKNNRPAFVMNKNGTPSLRVLKANDDIDNIQVASTGFAKVLDAGVGKGLANSPRVGYDSTGIGVTKDGRYVYFVTVMASDWLTLGTAMKYFGSHDGVGMDGGGSAQTAYRDPATSEVVSYNSSLGGLPRSIANIVGVYYVTQAPAIAPIATNLLPVAAVGENPQSDSFQVWNDGGMTLDYSLSDDADWLNLSEASGRSITQRNTVKVNYQTADLAPGDYSALITVSGAGLNPQIIRVNLTILPKGNKPPVVTASARVNTPTVLLPSSVEASVSASDPEGGSISYMWSAVSGAGSATFSNPASSKTSVRFTEAGIYVLRATISDGMGIRAVSDVTVKVKLPPAPIASNGKVFVNAGESVEFALKKGFDAANRPLIFSEDYLVRAPSLGTLSGTPPDLIYTPHKGTQRGSDFFEYKVKVGSQESLPGTGRMEVLIIPKFKWSTISVNVIDGEAAEPGSNPGRGTATIRLTSSDNEPVTIDYQLLGDASPGVDYTVSPVGPAPAGPMTSRYKTIVVNGTTDLVITPLADMAKEGPETVTFSVIGGSKFRLDEASSMRTTIAIADAQ